MEIIRILAINPGSTSTKIAVFQNEDPLFVKNIRHTREELAGFIKVADQYTFRKQVIIRELNESGTQDDHVKAVIGRGGLVKPISSQFTPILTGA